MASLMKQGERSYCQFLFRGKRHCFALGKVDPEEAEAKVSQVDYLLMRLRQGLLTLPPRMDIVTFLEFDGKPRRRFRRLKWEAGKVTAQAAPPGPPDAAITRRGLSSPKVMEKLRAALRKSFS